jgi:hypothetical protein
LLEIISTFLPTVNIAASECSEILNEIVSQYGLLKEQAVGWYGFLHLTIQEYFTAVAAHERGHEATDWILTRRFDSWWEEVILLLSGRLADASRLLEGLLGASPVPSADASSASSGSPFDIFHTDLLLAARCLAGNPRIQTADLRRRVVDELWNVVLIGPPIDSLLNACCRLLIEVGPEGTGARVLALLNDASILPVGRRVALARAIARRSDGAHAQSLVGLLKGNRIEEVKIRTALVEGLAETQVVGLALSLFELFQSLYLEVYGERVESQSLPDERPVMLSYMAKALGSLGAHEYSNVLLKMLPGIKDPIFAGGVVEALAAFGDPNIVLDLVDLVDHVDGDASFGFESCESLIEAIDLLAGDSSPRLLLSVFKSPAHDLFTIQEAQAAMSRRCLEMDVCEALVGAAMDTILPVAQRWLAVTSLGRSFHAEIANQLKLAVSSNTLPPLVRVGCLVVLGSWGDDYAASGLRAALLNQEISADLRSESGSEGILSIVWSSILDAGATLGDESMGTVGFARAEAETQLAPSFTRSDHKISLASMLLALARSPYGRELAPKILSMGLQLRANYGRELSDHELGAILGAVCHQETVTTIFEALPRLGLSRWQLSRVFNEAAALEIGPKLVSAALGALRIGGRAWSPEDEMAYDSFQALCRTARVNVYADGRVVSWS